MPGQAPPGAPGGAYASPFPYAGRPAGPYGYPQQAPWSGPGQPGRKSHAVAWIVVAAVAVTAVVGVATGLLLVRDAGVPFGPGTGEGPSAYGDDSRLDGLWDACGAGEPEACDDLFMESGVGTEYEEFGGSCGGRFPGTEEWCADVM